MMVLENIEHWEFSLFAEQNIIFKLNHFSIDDVPTLSYGRVSLVIELLL